MKIAKVIKSARENLRLSYRELSAACGVSASQLRRIESGESFCSVEILFRVAVSVGVPVADLLCYATEQRTMLGAGICKKTDDYEAAMGWVMGFGLDEAKAHRYMDAFITTVFNLLLESFSGTASGYELIANLTTSPACNSALESVGFQVEDWSNSERAMALRSLLQDPVRKMQSLGLVNFSILQDVIQAPGPCEYSGRRVASIVRTIGFSA